MKILKGVKKTRKNTKKPLYLEMYKPVDFSYLLGKVKGIDDELMKIHFKLYEGLVGATNGAIQIIKNTEKRDNVNNMVIYSSVQNQLGFFYNGMRLHELYFGVMAGENMDKMDGKFLDDLNKNFGSFDAWKTDFIKDVGNIPGVGFVVLCRDKTSGRMFNNWINEFQTGELIGVDPILVMDMWEHAYIAEFGLDLKKYKETFLKNVNWSVVSKCWIDSVNGIQNYLLKL
jgi:Fe-Mn family superoxide dismutase